MFCKIIHKIHIRLNSSIYFFSNKSCCTKPVVLNLSWFAVPFQRLLTVVAPCSSTKIPRFALGFAISRQSYLAKASACGPWKTAWWPLGGAECPGWETLCWTLSLFNFIHLEFVDIYIDLNLQRTFGTTYISANKQRLSATLLRKNFQEKK